MDYYSLYFLIGLFYQVEKTHQKFVNLAKGKRTTISTRYNDNYFGPEKAVDGNKGTYPLDCALSAYGQKEAWLQVDLGKMKYIASISFIHGGLGQITRPISRQDSGIYAVSDGSGAVYLSNGQTICSEIFSESNARVVCLIWGFLPEGVRFGSTRTSSGIWNQSIRCRGNEVNINQCPRESTSCVSGEVATARCIERGSTLSGFSVYVSDTQNWTSGRICYQHDIKRTPNNYINIDCVTSGRYVTIYNSRNNTSYTSLSRNAYINICEIDVQGCESGYYGEKCTRCPEHCLNRSCHFQMGYCFDCVDGYTGEICESECTAGYYGQRCSLTCGQCGDGATCNNVNGSCPDECSDGWMGDKCDHECAAGLYGENCSLTCGHCRDGAACNNFNGACLGGCSTGWMGEKCDLVCAETYHGDNCSMTCSIFCKYQLCDPTTGYCNACIERRSGDVCEIEAIVSASNVDTSNTTNIVLIAVIALSAIVLLGLITATLYCIKRKFRIQFGNSPESEYQDAVIKETNDDYDQMQMENPNETTDNETAYYSDISTIDVTSNMEYINLSLK